MTVLTLVRHGQASYMEDNYDRLSPLGERQAEMLGQYWLKLGIAFDHVFHGPGERHIRTGDIVGGLFHQAGKPWPAPAVVSEFDEFQGEEILRTLTPVLMERHQHIRRMAEAYEAASGKAEKRETLGLLFLEVARRWVDAEVTSPDVESWQQFTGRVGRGIQHVRACSRDASRVAVFTSGGPTAVTVAMALDLPSRTALDLAFRTHNASYSEFRLTEDQLLLNSYNSYSHLDDASLLTHR